MGAPRRIAVIGMASLCLGLLASGTAQADTGAYIVTIKRHFRLGGYIVKYSHHPGKATFVNFEGTRPQYWKLSHLQWRHWGHRRATAHGRLYSQGLYGAKIRIHARGKIVHCPNLGDKLWYTRVKLHVKSGPSWSGFNVSVDRASLDPQCNEG